MDRTSKIILAATGVGLALLFAAEYADRAAERQVVEDARAAARANIERAKAAKAERETALAAALPDLERRVGNANATSDHAAVVDILAPWEDVLAEPLAGRLAAARAAVEADRQRVEAERLAEQQRAAEQAKAIEQRLLDRIGKKPVASAWDGSYPVIEAYLRNLAHDPDSIDVQECSPAVDTPSGWLVRCIYRGKNAFGALIRKEQVFTIRFGEVVSVVNFE